MVQTDVVDDIGFHMTKTSIDTNCIFSLSKDMFTCAFFGILRGFEVVYHTVGTTAQDGSFSASTILRSAFGVES